MEGIYVGSIVESGEIIEELRDRIIAASPWSGSRTTTATWWSI